MADVEGTAPLAIEQDREQVVAEHAPDDFGHVGQQPVEVERLGGGGGNLQQEVEQLAPLAETYGALAASLHGLSIETETARAACVLRRPPWLPRS